MKSSKSSSQKDKLSTPKSKNSSPKSQKNSHHGTSSKWTLLKESEIFDPKLFSSKKVLSTDHKELSNLRKPHEFFELFLSDAVLDQIVEFSNLKANILLESSPRKLSSHRKKWIDLKRHDLKAYIAILIHMGITPAPSYKFYWTKDTDFRLNGIANTMSRDRFIDINKFISFYDPRNNTQPKGALFKLQSIYDAISIACQKYWIEKHKLSLDESMVAFTGNHSGRVYIPRKPVKNGFKIFVLADSSGYAIKFFPSFIYDKYTVMDVVNDLLYDYIGKGYHVYMDR